MPGGTELKKQLTTTFLGMFRRFFPLFNSELPAAIKAAKPGVALVEWLDERNMGHRRLQHREDAA
jgi:hypothetical protein